jgi:formylglycine-generating enzyme required for sulfatase activity
VAHEAIFWRWDKLRNWIIAERGFLAWRTGLEVARRAWEAASEGARGEALLMGYALAQARDWLARREADLPDSDRKFIVASLERRRRERARGRRVQGFIYVLLVGIILGLVAWMNQASIHQTWRWFTAIRPYMAANIHPFVLSAEAERALKPLAHFKECAKDCPEMVVIPAGAFRMGSPADENGRYDNEGPQHDVVFAKPFAVSSFDVTFDDWSVCASYGDCDPGISDSGFGRGRQPVINVVFEDARRYASWLARVTGKPYRLLTEAEWEYAARAGTTTAFSFGDDEAMLGRYAWYSKNSGRQAHAVGEKEPNAFGLYDMHGNVFQWVEDCVHGTYDGAPADGSAWLTRGDCSGRIVRGAAWNLPPHNLRSAYRSWYVADLRLSRVGFRVGRALGP